MTVISTLRSLVARQWQDFGSVIIVAVLLVVFRESVPQNRQPFTQETLLQDYGYPHKDDTVPSIMLGTVVWMIPVASFIIAGCVRALTVAQASQHFLSFATAYLLTGVFTNAIKLTVGRPRPSFLARCFPDTDLSEITTSNTALFTLVPETSTFEPICTNPDQDAIEGGYKSFCSGHTSYSACSGMFLTLFLVTQFRLFSGKASAAKAAVAVVPVFVGGWVGLTRIIDFEHHPTDVLAGFVLGCSMGALFYFHAQSTVDQTAVDVPVVQPAGTLHEVGSKPVAEAFIRPTQEYSNSAKRIQAANSNTEAGAGQPGHPSAFVSA